MAFLENLNKGYMEYPYIDVKKESFNFAAHYHEEIEVVYVVSGRTTLTIDTQKHILDKDDIYIIMPGEIHSFASESPNILCVLKLYSQAELFNYRIDGSITKGTDNYNILRGIISSIISEDENKLLGYQNAVNMYVNKLILNILRCNSLHEIPKLEQKKIQRNLTFLNAINTYLEENYAGKITLDDISKETAYSKYYFSHIFKDITSQSFVDYITAFRLKKSLAMLNTGKSVTQIALDCGFNNLRSYNRHFKKQYNTSPLKYHNTSKNPAK